MNDELREQFFTAMMRFKKMDAAFSTECEIQMNELTILQSITGKCSCGNCTHVNLDVPDIQERLQISKPAVSYILNTLEKKQYITRRIDPRDRRKISITATPEGMAAAEQASQKYEEMWNMLLTQFGAAQMQQLVALLTRLMELCEQLHCEETAGY